MANACESHCEEETRHDSDGEASQSEYDSSDMDDITCLRKRREIASEMDEIDESREFLKNSLFREKTNELEKKLEDIKSGTSSIFLEKVSKLKQDKENRIRLAEKLRDYRIEAALNRLQCEKYFCEKTLENDKNLLIDSLKHEIRLKIHKLEEDRSLIHYYEDTYHDSKYSTRASRRRGDLRSIKRKWVSGPYIVYMLPDNDIMDDWSQIKRALKNVQTKRKTNFNLNRSDKHSVYDVRVENDKLFCGSECFKIGSKIAVEQRNENTVTGSIFGISSNEIIFKRDDGNKCKIYVNHLQKGKSAIHAI